MGTAEVESALLAHEKVAEAAVVGYPHDIKGQGIFAYVTLMTGTEPSDALRKELVARVRKEIGPIAAPETIHLEERARQQQTGLHWIAGLMAFKAVLLEGLEVVFIVIAVGAARGLLWPASLGALAACIIVLLIGFIVHEPLSRVPENALKFGVEVMLSAFGVYWTGEGLGVAWPGEDLAVLGFAVIFLTTGLALAALLRRSLGVIAQ